MIKYYNRKTGSYETEIVVKEKSMKYIYTSKPGKRVLEHFIKKRLFTSMVGKYCDMKRSRKKIKRFIKNYNIDIECLKKSPDEFKSFNDFFIRELTEDARPIDFRKDILISPCDGKVLAYEKIATDDVFEIKGVPYHLSELIGSKEVAQKFYGGTCIIFRLCPTDYHRFHFIDNGICEASKKVSGYYYSVNPIALKNVPQVFCSNKRAWSLFHSEQFGGVLYIEVGATCVGTIVQSYSPNKQVKRGEEKGYFKFGGSTLILLIPKGVVSIDDDILKQTYMNFETLVKMGEAIGKKQIHL